ncbi:hypothetical protein OPV22_028301 [Ensete ventricosum]|uniref:Uncharacterized protein n=1 Tax=Ensete ventricosum TaxID=4639 RepID=A0AAV8Q2S8_ENSVE|nr:hypothetical protein OPV22_028301 [Ensete ventricosum]
MSRLVIRTIALDPSRRLHPYATAKAKCYCCSKVVNRLGYFSLVYLQGTDCDIPKLLLISEELNAEYQRNYVISPSQCRLVFMLGVEIPRSLKVPTAFFSGRHANQNSRKSTRCLITISVVCSLGNLIAKIIWVETREGKAVAHPQNCVLALDLVFYQVLLEVAL